MLDVNPLPPRGKEPVEIGFVPSTEPPRPRLYSLMATSDFQLDIPRSVADALSLPEGRKKEELRRELAVTLYREEMLSFGKARELAGLSKQAFGKLLGQRSVERHYGREELEEDLRYARDANGPGGETAAEG